MCIKRRRIMTQKMNMRVSQPQSAGEDAWMEMNPPTTALDDALDVLLYDDDVTNDDSDDDDAGEGDFCASGDATKRTRVRVEAIDDDDAQQVREMRRG